MGERERVTYSVVVLELNWEGKVALRTDKAVHHALYSIVWERKEAGTDGAEEVLEDMVNYSLCKEEVKKSGKVRLVELEKKTKLGKWQLEEGARLVVKRRSAKPSANRKLDEDIFKNMFMSRMADKSSGSVEPGMRKEERAREGSAVRPTRRGKRESSTRVGNARVAVAAKKRKTDPTATARGRQGSASGRGSGGGVLGGGRAMRGERKTTRNERITRKNAENAAEVSEKKLDKIRAGRERRMAVRKANLSSAAYRGGSRQWGAPPELSLTGMFRCHSKNEQNYRRDFATPVYCCCFLPVQHTRGRVIACTGGGHKVSTKRGGDERGGIRGSGTVLA